MRKRRNIVAHGRHVAIRYSVNSKRVYESLPAGSTMADAEALLAKRLLEARNGTWVQPSTTTVGQFLEEWLKKSKARDNTRRVYMYAVRRLVAAIGGVTLQKLTVAHVEQAKQHMAHLAPKTVNTTLDVGRGGFAWGQKMGVVGANPFALVDRLPLEESTKRSLTPDEAARLLAELRDSNNPQDLMLAFMLVSPRRYCEAAGLRKVDVDREHRQYTVAQVWLDTLHKFRRPDGRKNKHATYELMPTAAAILTQAELAQQTQRYECELFGWEWHDYGLVFAGDLGTPVPHSSLRQSLRYACKRAGVAPIAPHELRHTAISLLIHLGATKWEVMVAGGWKSTAMVERTYGHYFSEDNRKVMGGLEDLLNRRAAG